MCDTIVLIKSVHKLTYYHLSDYSVTFVLVSAIVGVSKATFDHSDTHALAHRQTHKVKIISNYITTAGN